MSFVTWNDVYHDLWMQAAQSRGTVINAAGLPAASWPTTLPEWPRTTGADAIAIAAVIDPILSAMPPRLGVYAIIRMWQSAIIDLEHVAVPEPSLEYVHNQAFWSTFLAVAAYLSTLAAPVPSDETLDALEAILWSPAIAYRNGTEPSTRTLTASTFSAMWEALRIGLAKLRGADLRDDELGGTVEVPRTTNADVLELEDYWSRPLVRLQVGVMTGALPTPDAFEDVQVAWQAVAGGISDDAARDRSTGLYGANLEFWRATRALARALDMLEEVPTPYEVIDEAASRGRSALASETERSTRQGTDLSSRLGELAENAFSAMAHVVNDASHRLVAAVGKPLLLTGAAVAALLLVLKATAPCTSAREPNVEPAPATATEGE